jgi:hypothetical protein
MMSESARLPRFVREALEGEAGSGEAGLSSRDASAAAGVSGAGAGFSAAGFSGAGFSAAGFSADRAELEFERTLLSLERALGASRPADNNFPEGDYHRLFERLQGTVSKAPHRYAPFYSRAAELFDLSEEAVEAEFARLEDPKVWKFAGLPGIHHVTVRGGPRVKSAETLFVRFKPGLHFPRHKHTGHERVLVLEGSYEDSHGVQHLPGELRDWESGTEHSFKVHRGEPCIFASVVFGREFYAWPLRALSKLLGK